MNVAVLRVQSTKRGWDPEIFLRDNLPGEQAPWWRAGDEHAGRTQVRSGFNLKIASAPSSSRLGEETIAWVHQHQAILKTLASAGARAEADIGVSVGTDDQFTASVLFSANALRVLVESDIDVKITAYPAGSREIV